MFDRRWVGKISPYRATWAASLTVNIPAALAQKFRRIFPILETKAINPVQIVCPTRMINITKKTKNNLRMDAIACTISHKMLFKPWVGPLKLQLHVQFFKWIKFLTPRMHWCNAVSYTESEFDFTVEKIMLNRILMQDWGLRMQCPSFVQVQSPWLRSGILKLSRLLCPILSLCHTVWALYGTQNLELWGCGAYGRRWMPLGLPCGILSLSGVSILRDSQNICLCRKKISHECMTQF